MFPTRSRAIFIDEFLGKFSLSSQAFNKESTISFEVDGVEVHIQQQANEVIVSTALSKTSHASTELENLFSCLLKLTLASGESSSPTISLSSDERICIFVRENLASMDCDTLEGKVNDVVNMAEACRSLLTEQSARPAPTAMPGMLPFA